MEGPRKISADAGPAGIIRAAATVQAEVDRLGGRGRARRAGPRHARLERGVHVQTAAAGVDDEGDVVPLAVVVAREVKGTAAAGIDVVGRILEVPGAEVAVAEEQPPAVRGERDVLVDDTAHAAGGGRLDPGADCQRVGIERSGAGDGDVLADAVQGQPATDFAGGPGGSVYEAPRVPIA